MMKARADDRRLLERGVTLNVMALVDSAGFDAEAAGEGVELADYGLKPGDLTELKRLFEHATTFGSLIQVPEGLAEKLPALKQLSEATSQDLFVSEALKRLGPLVRQAELLAAQYDAVVANPPYMGSKLLMSCAKDSSPTTALQLTQRRSICVLSSSADIALARAAGTCRNDHDAELDVPVVIRADCARRSISETTHSTHGSSWQRRLGHSDFGVAALRLRTHVSIMRTNAAILSASRKPRRVQATKS